MQKMHRFVSLFGFMAMLITLSGNAAVDGRADASDQVMGTIGAIVDSSSRIGKEEMVAMKMALEDFSRYSNLNLLLHIKNSQGDPLQAALAARDLVDEEKVHAVIGPRTWEETSLVAEICSQKSTPLLSIADATPEWATEKWNFLLQTSPSQYMQMKAVAAIVQSWEWYQVSIIYEDRGSSAGVLSHLSRALDEIGARISNLVAIPPFGSSSLSQQLEKIREGQCRVFVVHLSFTLALHLFETALKMDMMEKDYVWITTDTFTSHVHVLNSSTISSMQGIIGLKSYFPEEGSRNANFYDRFHKKFTLENPDEFNYEPGIFAARAYDSAWTLALAMRETNMKGGQVLLEKILLNNFTGVSGKIEFIGHKLTSNQTYQIINVKGKSFRELGFWSDGLGFSETISPNVIHSSSMKRLGQVLWPGGPWSIPRSAKPLRIGVPAASTFKQYVNVIEDQSENTTYFKGVAIYLFKAIIELLPYDLPYEFFAFNGTYDDLVEQVSSKKYDAAVGDVTILSKQYQNATFTQPYTDPGMVMVVLAQSKAGNTSWLFMKPFTKVLWILIVAITVYNGFVIWMIERNHFPELEGPVLHQTTTMLWLAFTNLFSLHGNKLHSNLSRMAMVVWLFVALIIMQTYTASLASMLTAERIEPTVDNIEQLRNSNAKVGCDRGSYLPKYFRDVLHFQPENIKQIDSPEKYAEALRKKEIAAAFLPIAVAKIFFAKNCKGFVQAGPTYKIGGFGFVLLQHFFYLPMVFPRESPLLHNVNQALLNLSENGTLRDLENSMLALEECKRIDPGEETSISAGSFSVLFILTGGTSTIALLVYISSVNYSCHRHKKIWKLIMAVIKNWRSQKRLFLRRVSNVA